MKAIHAIKISILVSCVLFIFVGLYFVVVQKQPLVGGFAIIAATLEILVLPILFKRLAKAEQNTEN